MSTLLPTGGPSGVSAPEQEALAALIACSRLLANQMGRETRANAGITISDYEIVARLAMSDGKRMRMSELAESTQSSRSRLSHQIDRMEAAGLVRREDCDEDRRGSFAVLTPAGHALWEKATPGTIEGIREHFFDRISERELEIIGRTFTKLNEHLEEVNAKPVITSGKSVSQQRGPARKSA